MRILLLLSLALPLAACVQPTLSKIDYRTFKIESGGIPGGSDAPNRRIAAQVCPNGYRVIDETSHQNTPDRARDEPGVFTTWTVRCL
ncbi:MAG TPA: hypothetical protein VNV18_10650 [Stellaceae bacterium]|jgi:hypothetical protein|nr:hypothetical protein [Stellaceae bacterium]